MVYEKGVREGNGQGAWYTAGGAGAGGIDPRRPLAAGRCPPAPPPAPRTAHHSTGPYLHKPAHTKLIQFTHSANELAL